MEVHGLMHFSCSQKNERCCRKSENGCDIHEGGVKKLDRRAPENQSVSL